MRVTLSLTKAEFDVVCRGVAKVLIDENCKSRRRLAGWKATRLYQVADELEGKLQQIEDQMKEMQRAKDRAK